MNELNDSELELIIDYLAKQESSSYDQNDLGISLTRRIIAPCGCAVRSAILALRMPIVKGCDYYWELRYRLGLLEIEADYLFANVTGIAAIARAYNLLDSGIYGSREAILRIKDIMSGVFRGLIHEQE